MRVARRLGWGWWLLCLAALVAPAQARDVPYVPTPEEVVRGMLELAKIGPDDLVYDLGSGDGRIVIMAAKEFGARGVGVDIDPDRIAEANENARAAGVADKVRFIQSDLFEVDLRPATAVTLYLLPEVNLRLRPKLLEELRPGTPVVSHRFDMGDWTPEAERNFDGRTVYLWHVPPKTALKRGTARAERAAAP
ncbi:RNA methyltransferase [Sulfurifustis variabilis]|uniref:RNA methyltransferase n=1 Tax=Sulfurifustis variabilis TaxID=1675686 RepID=A0A1B4V4G0_9GAMM|nr:class I SAM-dependent methyltransferase [Sulfurifustis variabilis]BAU48416.1 RNA methyltransferase [Sulfurifustis variabilis]